VGKIRMRKTICILISGKAGVGKSISASLLHKYLEERHGINREIFNFAKAVKETAKFLGWNGEKDTKGRRFLQHLGQTAREYNKDIWVEKTIYGEIEKYYTYPLDVVLIDDWRFPNEAEFISRSPLYEVVKLRIESPGREILKGTPEYNEESEISLPKAVESPEYYDYILFNEGTIEDLSEKLKVFWEFILSSRGEYIKWK